MDAKLSMNTRLYTDIQGLNQLRYNANSADAKQEVAQQFESILMQMVLSSMRNANKEFSSGLFSTDQMGFYQDMFDKQMSLVMSKSNSGFASMIMKNLDQKEAAAHEAELSMQKGQFLPMPVRAASSLSNSQSVEKTTAVTEPTSAQSLTEKPKNESFQSQEDFVKKLWPSAKIAASIIGGAPEVLIAQAALETNWGKNVLPHDKNTSSNNLFNLKAGSSWASKTTSIDTLEQKNGVLYKEKSNFRSYDSYTDSFMDYANFLKTNERYKESLNKAENPGHFVHALQKAGYATDQEYGNKIMKIFKSDSFKNLIAKVKAFI